MKLTTTFLAGLALLVLVACGGDNAPIDITPRKLSVAQLHPDIAKIYADPYVGSRCSLPLACNGTIRVDCAIEVDGPQVYYRESDGLVLMNCGGTCMGPDDTDPKSCQSCPPKQWTCAP